MSDALSENVVRPGCRVMKLDAGNDAMLFDPKTWSAKRRAERQKTIDFMRDLGDRTMLKIGPDEYRTVNRAERRRARKVGKKLRQREGSA